jgi:RNA polymerase sigma-70 factor (ECF subfamily)
MNGRDGSAGSSRALVYCLVPADLAPRLHEPLRRHFRGDPSVEVVVEARVGDRRGVARRTGASIGGDRPPGGRERRLVRARAGRRVAERRFTVVEVVAPPALPRRARAHARRLVFVERLEPSTKRREDTDTARLVARIQSGDRDAFALLYMRYFGRVYGYLRILLRDEAEAEDGVQHVFMKVFEALGRYELRRQPFRAWLFTIVRNHALNQLARQQRLEPVDPAEISRRQDEQSAGEEDTWALDWLNDRELLLFVERLPLAQRQVLLLRYMLDLSHRDVAAILGRSAEDVRGLQHRALRSLRERLVAIGRAPAGNVKGQRRILRCPKQAPVIRRRRFALLD